MSEKSLSRSEHRCNGAGMAARQAGFTIIEMAVTIILIGIALFLVSLSYANSRKAMRMKSGVDEIRAVMERAYNIAMEEGVEVYLQFWSSEGTHPNRCAIYRVYPDGTDERDNDTPTEPPPPGVTADTDGNGHYWFKIAGGSVAIQSPVMLHFSRTGALVTVSSVEGDMSVTIGVADQTRTIAINERGEISS